MEHWRFIGDELKTRENVKRAERELNIHRDAVRLGNLSQHRSRRVFGDGLVVECQTVFKDEIVRVYNKPNPEKQKELATVVDVYYPIYYGITDADNYSSYSYPSGEEGFIENPFFKKDGSHIDELSNVAKCDKYALSAPVYFLKKGDGKRYCIFLPTLEFNKSYPNQNRWVKYCDKSLEQNNETTYYGAAIADEAAIINSSILFGINGLPSNSIPDVVGYYANNYGLDDFDAYCDIINTYLEGSIAETWSTHTEEEFASSICQGYYVIIRGVSYTWRFDVNPQARIIAWSDGDRGEELYLYGSAFIDESDWMVIYERSDIASGDTTLYLHLANGYIKQLAFWSGQYGGEMLNEMINCKIYKLPHAYLYSYLTWNEEYEEDGYTKIEGSTRYTIYYGIATFTEDGETKLVEKAYVSVNNRDGWNYHTIEGCVDKDGNPYKFVGEFDLEVITFLGKDIKKEN